MPAEDTPTPPRKKIHLVPVEGEEELERVLVEDLDCRVEQRDGEQLAVGRVPDGEDVVRHFQSLGVNEREDLLLELEDVRTTKAGQNSVDFELSILNDDAAKKLTVRVTPKRSVVTCAPSSTSTISKSQNLTSLSALPDTRPFLSGRTWMDQTAPECA